jgi:protein-S-isoprenylcysteine O-methyltransferase Ste14
VALASTCITFMFLVDVAFATAGYILTFRPLDSHIRTANPYAGAWAAALICYPPFVLMADGGPLDYHHGSADWTYWYGGHPMLLAAMGVVLVGLTAIYAWATVAFGMRFSNLTHRGVLTHGPYAWSRHPAYLSKNLFWWFSTLPFLATTGWVDGIRNAAVMACVSGVYYWRARTEEKHLGADPAYRDYSAWMARNGPVSRLLPVGAASGLKRSRRMTKLTRERGEFAPPQRTPGGMSLPRDGEATPARHRRDTNASPTRHQGSTGAPATRYRRVRSARWSNPHIQGSKSGAIGDAAAAKQVKSYITRATCPEPDSGCPGADARNLLPAPMPRKPRGFSQCLAGEIRQHRTALNNIYNNHALKMLARFLLRCWQARQRAPDNRRTETMTYQASTFRNAFVAVAFTFLASAVVRRRRRRGRRRL